VNGNEANGQVIVAPVRKIAVAIKPTENLFEDLILSDVPKIVI
jgi:hypothetical protein